MFTIEERIRMYEEKLGRVVFPLRTTHYDTKLALDLLLHKNHFTDICRLAFGPIGVTTVGSGASSSSSSPTDDVCWMDVANNGPDTPIGQRILHFLAPGGIFHSVMENLSVPNGTFHASIKSQWKDQVVVASPTGQRSPANDGVDLTKRFDYPLSALCGFSKQVISENRDADLTSMGRHRIPPFMLIPFWQPPLVTREESTTRQPQNSLPCTMLGYFMLRMMQFVHHRCCNGSRSVLSQPKESSSTWRRALKTLSSMVSDAQMNNCREFPATLRLLAAYHEFYNRHAAQNHYSKLQLSRSLDDASWDVGGTVLQMLIHCPSSLWLRRVPLVVAETQRLPFADAGSVACLTVLVPYLADVLQNQTQVSGMAAMAGNPMTDANSDARLTAAFDVQRPHIAVYRNGLSALRSATQNYARIQQCAPKHFEHLFQLWKALLLPCAAEANQDMRGAALSSTRESSVLQRYEALTYGFGDVVGMIGNSACIDVMTEVAAQHFMSCLGIFRDDLVARVLADTAKHIRISTEGLDARSGPSSSPQQSQAFVSYLKAHFVLHWDRSDGLTVIPHMEGPEIQAQVARAVMAIWRRTDPECLASTTSTPTLPPPVVAILRQCSETLLRIVPGAKSQAEKLRDDYSRHASTRHQTDPMTHSMTFDTLRTDEAGNTSSARVALPPARTSGLLSNDERQQYLDGNSGACRAVRNAGELKFPTRQGRRLDVVHSGEPILRSDEFPPLVVASLWIDDAMELLQTIMHRRRVPRCHNGHPMWLVEDVSKRCNQHHDQEGTWECHACQVSFCSAYCRPVVPVDPANQLSVLRPITPAEAQRYCCDQCHMVFVSDRTQKVFTSVVATEAPLPNGVGEDAAVYCAQCASRPFRPIVTRVVAAYSTMWAVLTACIFSWLLWVLIRPR